MFLRVLRAFSGPRDWGILGLFLLEGPGLNASFDERVSELRV